MPDQNLAVLILAAGASTRMGKPKQLLPWKNTTLLGNMVSEAKKLTNNILVVLGAHAEVVKKTLHKNVPFVINIGWQAGMGSSIALGVQELEQQYRPERILIVLIDQPLIDHNYLKKMVAEESSKLVTTKYGDHYGVPALFPKSYFEELKTLGADFGARHLLKKYADAMVVLDAKGKSVDLDTPENYAHYFKTRGL